MAAPAIAAPAPRASSPAILFAADAPNAVVSGNGRALSLPARSRLAWFTDRPARSAGTTTVARLVEGWAAWDFDAQPPNAALVLQGPGERRVHVVELTRPRVARGRAIFRVRPLPTATEAGRAHQDPIRPGRYRRAELLIDDAGPPPCREPIMTATTCVVIGDYDVLVSVQRASSLAIEACQVTTFPETRVAIARPWASAALPACPSWSSPITAPGPTTSIRGVPSTFADVQLEPVLRRAWPTWMVRVTASR